MKDRVLGASFVFFAKVQTMTDPNKTQQAVVFLLDAYNALSPSRFDRVSITNMASEMRKSGESDTEICKAIVCRLLDGVAYGNWPSTSPNARDAIQPKK